MHTGDAFHQNANETAGQLKHLVHFHHRAVFVQVRKVDVFFLPILLHHADKVAVTAHRKTYGSDGCITANVDTDRHFRINSNISHCCERQSESCIFLCSFVHI